MMKFKMLLAAALLGGCTAFGTSGIAQADTPDDITAKLAGALGKAMASEEGRAFSAKNPGQPLALAMKELGEFQLREYTRLKRAADAAGIKPE